MALGTTNISTSLVAQTIGEGSNDVGTLCKSTKINKWSKWKPIAVPKPTGLTVTELIAHNCGFTIPYYDQLEKFQNLGEWIFNPPRGVYTGVNEPFRLGDFRNYNHDAPVPFTLTMQNNMGGTNLLVVDSSHIGVEHAWYEVRLEATLNRDMVLADVGDIKDMYLTVAFGSNIANGGIGSGNYIVYQHEDKIGLGEASVLSIDTSRFGYDGVINPTYNTIIAVFAAPKITSPATSFSQTFTSLKFLSTVTTYVNAVTGYLYDGATGGTRPVIPMSDYTMSWSIDVPTYSVAHPNHLFEFSDLVVDIDQTYSGYKYRIRVRIPEVELEVYSAEYTGDGTRAINDVIVTDTDIANYSATTLTLQIDVIGDRLNAQTPLQYITYL